MKTTLRYLHLNAKDTWHRQVEERLDYLHGLMPITAAEVVLEHQRDVAPAFCVAVRLEVPGPGLHDAAGRKSREKGSLLRGPFIRGEGRDSTLDAALLKATQAVEDQLKAHTLRQRERSKSKLQLSAISGRWTHAQAGRRA